MIVAVEIALTKWLALHQLGVSKTLPKINSGILLAPFCVNFSHIRIDNRASECCVFGWFWQIKSAAASMYASDLSFMLPTPRCFNGLAFDFGRLSFVGKIISEIDLAWVNQSNRSAMALSNLSAVIVSLSTCPVSASLAASALSFASMVFFCFRLLLFGFSLGFFGLLG